MKVFVMTKVTKKGEELVRISDVSTDYFENRAFKATKSTLFGNAERCAKAYHKAGYKFV